MKKFEGKYMVKLPRDQELDGEGPPTFCLARINVLVHDQEPVQKVEWYLSREYYEDFGIDRDYVNGLLEAKLPKKTTGMSYSAEVEELGFMGSRYISILDEVILKALEEALVRAGH